MTDGDRIGRDLDTLLDAADAEASAASDNRGLPPFAAVMARASRIDPGNASNREVSTRSSQARASSRDPDAILDDLVVAARAEAATSVTAREGHAPPPWVDQRRTTVGLRAAVGGAIAAIAAAVAVVMVFGGDGIGRAAHDRDDGSLAAAQATVPDAQGRASAPAGLRKTTAAPSPNATAPIPPPQSPSPNAGTEPGATSENSATSPQPPPPAPTSERHDVADATQQPAQIKRRPSRRKTIHRPTIEELDALAREALAVGDLAGADAALAALIDRNSRGRLEEAAFGDRFAIAHRLRNTTTQRRLWRVYLERFPSGRFAEEARAGLCRHNPAEDTACWQRYLDDYPSGTYRAQAQRALADSPSTPSTEDQP